MVEKGDPLGIMYETEVWPHEQIVMHKREFVLENRRHEIPMNFEIQSHPQISTRRPDLVIINNNTKKRTFWIVDFSVPADQKRKER